MGLFSSFFRSGSFKIPLFAYGFPFCTVPRLALWRLPLDEGFVSFGPIELFIDCDEIVHIVLELLEGSRRPDANFMMLCIVEWNNVIDV